MSEGPGQIFTLLTIVQGDEEEFSRSDCWLGQTGEAGEVEGIILDALCAVQQLR